MRRSDDDCRSPGADPSVRRLTAREQQVARLVAQGLKDAVIARRLGLSGSTVGGCIRRVQWRLKLASRAEIAAWVTARLDPANPTSRLQRLDPARQPESHPDGHLA